MIKRLLIFSSICSYAAMHAIAQTPNYPQSQLRPMQSADTHVLYAALRNAQQHYKEMPRMMTVDRGTWFERQERAFYSLKDLINATKSALHKEGLNAYIIHVPQPRPMILVRLEHTSGQFTESEVVVPQHPHYPTPTQGQYNVAEADAYANLVGLECPLENIVGAQEAAAPSEAPQN